MDQSSLSKMLRPTKSLSFLCRIVCALACVFAAESAVAAQFTPGNIAVVRVGGDALHHDGVASLTSATAPVFIDEFALDGTYVQTLALPTVPSGLNFPLTLGGSTNSEGQLHLSTDGHFLALTGYDIGTDAPAPSGFQSVTVPRTVAVVAFDGTIDTTTALTDFANSNNARAAFTTNGSSVWLAGADATTGGIRYIGTLGGSTSVDLTGTALKNCRDVAVFGLQLYFAQDKKMNGSIVESLGTGLPNAGTQLAGEFPGSALNPAANSATAGFFFARLGSGPTYRGYDTLYVTDGASTATDATPGISKYSFDGLNWGDSGTIGSINDAYQGLTGKVDGGVVTLYATQPGGVYSVVDPTGFNGVLSATPVLLAKAPKHTAVRGIAFVPVSPTSHTAPVIAAFGPDLSYQVTATSPTVPVETSASIFSNAPNFLNGSLTVFFSANGQPEDQLGITNSGQIAVNGSQVSYSGAAIGTFTGGANGSPLIVTFNSTSATPAAAQALLASITYHNTAVAGQESLAIRTVSAVVNDGTASDNLSAPVELHISFISNNNKPPGLTVPGAQAALEDTVLHIPGITVLDPDAGSNPIVVVLSVMHGAVSVQTPLINGVPPADVAGNFSSTVTLTGSQSTINTTFAATVTYLGNPDFNGSDVLTITADDQGNSGPGGKKTEQKTIAITVAPVNDAPTPVPDTATVNRNSSANLIDVLANDTDPENDALAITDITAPAHGTVALVNGKVSYTPAPGFVGTDTFSYSISDGRLPGIQVVDIFNAQNFIPLTIDNGLTYLDNGIEHVTLHDGGYGSGMCPVPGVANEFYMTRDRGVSLTEPNGRIIPIKAYQPTIIRVRVNADGSSTIVARILLKNESGQPLNSLPNADNPSGDVVFDINNAPIDTSNNFDGFTFEGIVALPDGTFWLSDEYGPFVVHFDSSGKIVERLKPLPSAGHKLPNVLIKRVPNRGLEGFCITPDGTKLVACMQTAPFNNGTTNTPDLRGPNNNNAQATAALRIIVYTLATGQVQEHIYLLEQPAFKAAVSEIAALSNTDFLVDERDSEFSSDGSRRKRLWRISLTGASDVHDPNDSLTGLLFTPGIVGPTTTGQSIEQLTFNKTRPQAQAALAAVGITPVTINAAAAYDLLQFGAFNHDKMEGMAVINGGKTVVVSNDDNNGVLTQNPTGNAQYFSNYVPGTHRVDGSQLLFINAYQTVTVNVVNHAPIANNLALTVSNDVNTNGTLPAADVDGDALTYSLSTNAANGTVTVTDAATGAFTYTPNAGYVGADSFTFIVNDGNADSNVATVTLTVQLPPIPTITSGPTAAPAPANVGDTVEFTATADLGAQLSWNFGDGTEGTGSPVSHVFQSAGVYTVTLSATAANHTATQTLVLTVNEFGTGLIPIKLPPPKTKIVLNFSVPETYSDSVALTGRLRIPQNFNPAGQRVAIKMGGLVQSFILLADGSSIDGDFNVTIKSRNGMVRKQTAPFTLTLSNTNFKNAFAGLGLTVDATKGRHALTVEVVLGNTVFKAVKTLLYSRTGNVGTAK